MKRTDMSMKIWYMRDNHTFLSLPPDVDAAMVELRRAFIEKRDTYGSLCCTEGPMRNKMEHARADWLEFEPRARKWIEAALKPTDAEIEYTSWLTPNALADRGSALSEGLGQPGRTYTRAQLLAAIEAERQACSIAVWMTLQDALEPGADDKGLEGWMREAEQRVKNRLAHHGPAA